MCVGGRIARDHKHSKAEINLLAQHSITGFPPQSEAGLNSPADWASALWAIYADADRLWIVAPWSRAQEAINVFWTSGLNIWLIWAIATRRAYRHVLQLALGSYLSYSVILYWLAGHLSGYEGMRSRTAYAFILFYGTALPWLAAHLYMTYDSAVAITRRFANAATRPGR